MNLKTLKSWCEKMKDEQKLREIVRKDIKGNPVENDVRVSISFLSEIIKRIGLVDEHIAKAEKYQTDILDYLKELDKRKVSYSPNSADETRTPEPEKPLLPSVGK